MTTASSATSGTSGTAEAAPAPTATPARRRGRDGRALRLFLPLAVYTVFTVVPFYWMLLFALRPVGSTSLLPWPLTTEHFHTVWDTMGFAVFFRNSVAVAVATLAVVTVFALMGGYALARFRFRGRRAFMLALLCTQFVPGAMMLIPLFNIFRTLDLIDSRWSLVIAETTFQLPLAMILMSGFVRNVPVELEESAMVDGCGRIRAFLAVVLPLLRPGIVAVGSFAFIGSWNNFLFALMFLNDPEKQTVPVGLSTTMGENTVDFGALAAGGVVAAVPVVLVFAVVQRYLVQGLSAGAVKG
ncbi:carbohydrate ABC transporter permease [Peterkaempfera bronchialis]|uniref:Carbohydrate ABC transporter permease n=1 Tax=Peterkaempfera bronchialis TaxID=2126346 RepID=A0A345T6R0_9ACTN|nr:carbohydrate ABC transporter permease [Peterkaempfera bronchialis]AXI81665.1 carbohydrate ABC transporter permease [Peterkaempfera bronchialis]